MITMLFIYDKVKTPIQCKKEDKIKDICDKFASIDINSLKFIYNGKELDLDSTFDRQASTTDKNRKEMIILVEEKSPLKNFQKSPHIICPTCQDNCRISIENYKIKLFDCKNGHSLNNILLSEYNDTQNNYKSNIICNNCNKSGQKENKFYKCLTCKQDICNYCKDIHSDKHKMIDYDKINIVCNYHNEPFNSYCQECRVNLCSFCEKMHNTKHTFILYKDMIKNEREIIEKMKIFGKKINELKDNIKEMISILKKVMENIETYKTINLDILNSFDNIYNNKNYCMLQNIRDIESNIYLNDIDEIINNKDINFKFQKVLDLYEKMNEKDIEDGERSKRNEIKLTYKFESIDKKIKIFDVNFITNNKDKCKFKYQDKVYELTEYLDTPTSKENNGIIEIILTGTNKITNLFSMFYECSSLLSLNTLSTLNTIKISDISYMFYGCKSLLYIPEDISKWKTNNVKDISYMFYECVALERIPDISNWETNKVCNLSNIFGLCLSLKSLPDISKWKTDNVIKMKKIFFFCKFLQTIPDISKWRTNNVTEMSCMFYNCKELESLPDISKWNTSKVTDISYIFYGCSSITELPDISIWDTKRFYNISYTFYSMKSLTSLPDISKWNTNNVSDMSNIFYSCSNLVSIPDISKWITVNVNKMDYMFYNCSGLKALPDISRWDTLAVNDMSYMFYDCSSLVSLPDISKWNTLKVKNMSNMFSHCKALTSLPDISVWKINNLTNVSSMFAFCSSLVSLPDISKWAIKNVMNMSSMFEGCKDSLNIPKGFNK